MKKIEQLLNFTWWGFGHSTHDEGHDEINRRANHAKGIWLDSEEPIWRNITQEAGARYKHNALVLEDVKQGYGDTCQHTRYRALATYATSENTHKQRREQ